MKIKIPAWREKIFPVAVSFALASCATDNLAAGLPLLEGQPVAQAVHYLGAPTEKQKTDGQVVYAWINNQSGTFYTPDTTATPVVTGSGSHAAISFAAPNTSPMQNSYNWHCRLDITASRGVIVHAEYDGDAAGCKIFSDKLKPLVAAAQGER